MHVLIITGITIAGLALLCYFKPERARILFNIFRAPFDWIGEGCQQINQWCEDQLFNLTGERNIRLGYVVGNLIVSILVIILITSNLYLIGVTLQAVGLPMNLDWLSDRLPVTPVMTLSIAIIWLLSGVAMFDLLGKTHFLHWNLSPRLRRIFLIISIIVFTSCILVGCLMGWMRGILINEAYATTLEEESTYGEIISVESVNINNTPGEDHLVQDYTFNKINPVFYSLLLGLEILVEGGLFFALWSLAQHVIIVFLKIFAGIMLFIIRLPVYLIEMFYNLFARRQVLQTEATPVTRQIHHESTTAITSAQSEYDVSTGSSTERDTEEEKGEGNKEPESNEPSSAYLPGLEKPVEEIKSIIKRLASHREMTRPVEGIIVEGLPKTGKTALLETLKRELRGSLFLRASDFSGISDEEIKRRIYELRAEAEGDTNSTVLIDDLDSICGKEDGYVSLSPCTTTFVNTLIALFDEQKENLKFLIIIATCKNADALPETLRSKFSEKVNLELPERETRRRLLKRWLSSDIALTTEQEERILDNTQGYNYQALQSLCQKILLPQTPMSRDEAISHALSDTTPVTEDTRLEFLEPVSINDIGGFWHITSTLRTIARRFRNRKRYENAGVNLPRGILLYGPPGTGKTYIARAFANLLGYKCIKVDSEKIGSPYIYQAERNLAQVFRMAQNYAPCVLVMDEFETLARKRGSSLSSEAYEGVVGVLLRHLDGLDTCKDIFVIAITNMKDSIDEAVLRSGRIGIHLEVGLPDKESRRAIFEVHLRNKKLRKAEDINLDKLSTLTEGFNCADIANIIDSGASLAIDQSISENKEPVLTMKHLEEAYRRLKAR